VVVATRDRCARLAVLLSALEAQDLPGEHFEVVVIDDGSRDATPELLRSHPHVRTLRHARAGGPARARNAGWRLARAPLVAFTDDDCRPEPGWLRAGLTAHASAPGAVVQGATRPEPAGEELLRRPLARSVRVQRLGPFFQTCNVFYPRALLERVAGFDESIPTAAAEDTDLALRAFELGAGAVWAPGALVNHDVVELPLARAVRGAWRWRTMVPLVRRHPRLRAAFPWHGRVWRESHARLALALAGTALARRHPAFAAWWLPYLALGHGWGPRALARSATELPQRLPVDLAELAVLGLSSARHRRLLL